VFGEGDGRLATATTVARRLVHRQAEQGASTNHRREVRTRRDHARTYASPDNPPAQERANRANDWDDFAVVPALAHERGMRAELYVSVLDEGKPLASKRERNKSFHNAMHGQHVTWQSTFSRANPELTVVDRSGDVRQWGVLSFAYPEVRQHFRRRIARYLDDYNWDGVFLCLRVPRAQPLRAAVGRGVPRELRVPRRAGGRWFLLADGPAGADALHGRRHRGADREPGLSRHILPNGTRPGLIQPAAA
jgi:hypothetical protein